MTITIGQLIEELEVHAPQGVELPRDPASREIRTATIERWAQDAAQAINRQRRKTTKIDHEITIVGGESDYDLPAGTREVVAIARARTSGSALPSQLCSPCSGYFPSSTHMLPSGQSITGSLDMIQRMDVARQHRELEYELVGGKLRLLFPTTDGETIIVTTRTIDRSLASIPDDRFELMLTYLQWKNIDWFIGKHGSNGAIGRDSLVDEGMAPLFRRRAELQEQWDVALASMGPEAD